MRLFRHDREPRDADHRDAHHVVGRAKIVAVAGDHPISPRIERRHIKRRGHRDVMVRGLIVRRRRQVGGMRAHGGQREDRRPVGVVVPAGGQLAPPEASLPVGLCQPQVNLRKVAVVHAHDGPGRGPRPLRDEREITGFDLRDEIAAHRAAYRLRMRLRAGQRDRAGLDEITGLADELGEVEAGERGRLVVAGALDEGLERRLLPLGELRAHGRTARPQDPIEVGREERRAVGIGAVKLEQRAEQRRGLDEGRALVAEAGSSLGHPGTELVERAERGGVCIELERVLRSDEPALARGHELERIMGDHIPHRWPVGVGHRARLHDRRPLGDRELLERRPLRAASRAHSRGEPRADLLYDSGQVPLGDLRKVLGVGAALRALLEPPAVHLEIAPRPVGADGFEDAAGFGRRLLHRGRELDEPLGIVRRPVARLGENPRRDGPRDLGPGLVLERRLLDAPERLGGRLGFALVEGLLHALPRRRPRAVGSVVRPRRTAVHDRAPEDQDEAQNEKPERDPRTCGCRRSGHRKSSIVVWAPERREAGPPG